MKTAKTRPVFRTKHFMLTLAFGLIVSINAGAQAAEKPNVVLMLADNVGWGDVGVYSGGEIRGMFTFRIDKLAAEGMQMI